MTCTNAPTDATGDGDFVANAVASGHRAICPSCHYSIRLGDDGRVVDHADPRFGAVGLCPGSGRGNVGVMEMPTVGRTITKDPRDGANRPGA